MGLVTGKLLGKNIAPIQAREETAKQWWLPSAFPGAL